MAFVRVDDICAYLDSLAPFRTAADWDNVGLLLGDGQRQVKSMMTCLTITSEVVTEAIEHKADLIISHHPLMHRPVRRLTSTHPDGKILLDLAEAKIAVISAHTAFDNATGGINEQIATALGLTGLAGLRAVPDPRQSFMGEGRLGQYKQSKTLGTVIELLKQALNISIVNSSAANDHKVESVAIACGAGGEFLGDAIRQRADVFITGEIRFHDVLFAKAHQVAVISAGHYATERFAMEHLAKMIQGIWTDITVWASQKESNPLEPV